jgi:mgtE-like transporter
VKKRNPLMMIRQLGTKLTQSIIRFVIFLFKKINYIVSIPSILNKDFKGFFKSSYSIIEQSLIALIICAVGDLCAGLILGNMTSYLQAWPGLLTLVPGTIGMRGNIFGAFGSRLGTDLNVGMLSPKLEKSKILNQNILSSIILTMILSIFLAFITKFICLIFNLPSMSIFDFILISFFTGIISSIIMLPLSMLISLKSFQHGWDPDNITTPLIAAFGDFFTLPSIILSILLISLFNDIIILRDSIAILLVIIAIIGVYHGYKSDKGLSSIVKQSTPVLLVCSILGSFAGGILNSSTTTLLSNPSLLTLVPLFSGESGNLVSILGARLSSGLHLGLIEPSRKPEGNTLRNFAIIIILAIIIYPTIGILADSSSLLMGIKGIGFLNIATISFIAGMVMIFIMIIIVYYISTISYKKGLDPDNIVIPLSASVTDSISTLMLILSSLLILSILAL